MLNCFEVEYIKVLHVKVAAAIGSWEFGHGILDLDTSVCFDARGHMFLDVGVGAGMGVGTCFWM